MDTGIKTLEVKKAETLHSLEEKVRQLGSDVDYKLRLPASLNTRGALGIEVAVLQLIGTWLRSNNKKHIFHSHQKDNADDFKELCESVYGIAVLSLVDEIWDSRKKILPKGMVLSGAKSTIESLKARKFDEVFKRHYFGIPCIKRPGYDREFEMPHYNGGEVVDSSAFYEILKVVIKDALGARGRYKKLEARIDVREVSEMLWELFKNTHDHGRHDSIGDELITNFRALIVQHQDLTADYVDRWCSLPSSNAQVQFKENIRTSSNKHHILDISVVDMGSGFIDLAMEKSGKKTGREVLLWCLTTGNSRLGRPNRGDGLTKVLSQVSKNGGWIRIRTKNLVLEKAYSKDADSAITLGDIREVSGVVSGTTVHISIPLNNDKFFKGEA